MTRIAVLVCGGIGVAVVARAAAFYRSVDLLSFALVLLIGVGFVAGIGELLLRASKAHRLHNELSKRPPQGPESLDGYSVELATLLRRRLAGTQAQPTAWFSTYLVGLLVMLGMLGTFLGLFESLRGAREALTSSGDVDALRAALASPLQGLWRAFGSSAAGVSTSAALGLAAVFARRAEAALASAVAATTAGPLSAWTTAGRQTAALESIARHGPDLAASAASLQDAARQLDTLRHELLEAHRLGADRMTEAVRATAAEVRSDIQKGVDRAAEATGKAVEPMVERLTDRAGAVADAHLMRWTARIEQESAARELAQRDHLDQVGRVVRDAASSVSAEVRPGVQALERRVAEAIDQAASRMTDLAEESARRDARSYSESSAKLDSLAQETSRRFDLLATESAERMASLSLDSSRRLELLATESAERLAKLESGQGAVVDALDQRLVELLDKSAESDRARSASLAAGLGELMTVLQSRLDTLALSEQERASLLRDRLEQTVKSVDAAARSIADGDAGRLAALREVAARMQADLSSTALLQREHVDAVTRAVASLANTLDAVEARSTERMDSRVDRLVEGMASQVQRLERGHEERAEAARLGAERLQLSAASQLERLEALHETRMAEARRSLDQLEARVAEQIAALGQGLTAPLEQVIESARQAPEAALAIVRATNDSLDRQRLLERAREERSDELIARLSAAADAVSVAATRQAERLEALAQATGQASAAWTQTSMARIEAAEARSDARLDTFVRSAEERTRALLETSELRHQAFLQAAEQRSETAEQGASRRLGELLDRVQEGLDLQSERLALFEQRLEATRSEGALLLSERIAEHARVLGDNLGTTAGVVREAGDLVRAGGAEMSAVAEMFTAAVDQYRAASDRLLDGLGPIEVAIDRMGQRDTADLLGAYLDQTREVFDSSLRFQRELFAELRALRAGSQADA